MRYVKYTIHLRDNRKVELARSYRNGQRIPPCPFRWGKMSVDIVAVTSEFCDFKEKAKLWRRSNHAFYEPLIDILEAKHSGEVCCDG